MKIIAGALKGKTVHVRHSRALRPTSAKVRESLFNIIGQRVVSSVFVDLYAGSGAVGFEALSRGAQRVVFVDIDRHAVETIKKNPAFYENPLNAAVCCDVVSITASRQFRGQPFGPFDIVFADPPYDSGEIDRLLPTLELSLRQSALVIIEHSTRKSVSPFQGGLTLLKTYKYGDASLSVYAFSTEDKNE